VEELAYAIEKMNPNESACPECDFQLWHNLLSDETVTSNMRVDINHSGFYAPEELDMGMTWQKD
jgi:hypothetical protein